MEKNVPKKGVNEKNQKESSRLSKFYFPGAREIASSASGGEHGGGDDSIVSMATM
jgi:hypothetical protein